MEYKNIIIKPKSFSKTLLTYFILFLKNYKLLVAFNFIVLLAFYCIISQIEVKYTSNNLTDYISKSLLYALFFTLPTCFISTFYLVLLTNQKPTYKNILIEFLKHPFKIFFSNFLLCSTIFLFNLIIKSEFLVIQYSSTLIYFFIEVIYTIVALVSVIFINYFSPYSAPLNQILSKNILKYFGILFILILFNSFIYRLNFNLLINTIDLSTEILNHKNPDFIYNTGLIIIEYINEITIITILLFVYYNYVSEIKNTFHTKEINQIKLDHHEMD